MRGDEKRSEARGNGQEAQKDKKVPKRKSDTEPKKSLKDDEKWRWKWRRGLKKEHLHRPGDQVMMMMCVELQHRPPRLKLKNQKKQTQLTANC